MDDVQSVSLPSSGSSIPQVSHCDWLQLCNADIRKYTNMHTGVMHTLNSLAPYLEEEDHEKQELIQRQTHLKERIETAFSVSLTLYLAVILLATRYMESPLTRQPKLILRNFLNSLVNPIKRKESVEGFISPTSRQTVKTLYLKFRNLT
ncbi:hypothetical protein TNIN_6381 [Trichonephila inaurata madagascariensis]|uniref:Uncharacterized protein n=1 Tax=Trichonephila inaurata madagascariensis TaxID=2747483 RepID=A0A8X6Y2V0_9ARAC|nr:hypothetical protein TNIN_6381 [Trichonephila inaurata madagascariensis]